MASLLEIPAELPSSLPSLPVQAASYQRPSLTTCTASLFLTSCHSAFPFKSHQRVYILTCVLVVYFFTLEYKPHEGEDSSLLFTAVLTLLKGSQDHGLLLGKGS